ncbi:hypothetical protein PI124_g23375 [Phytophthora idaei]|nr:hypothetical protein PI125_g25488 [Phytophthora idaei]KAG3124122.1 hypothetical protein PI126_g23391 [Phytophthora idaei]KAG3231528.1 hypothetical protein PI124_g23375 [Phytophthora idaei]
MVTGDEFFHARQVILKLNGLGVPTRFVLHNHGHVVFTDTNEIPSATAQDYVQYSKVLLAMGTSVPSRFFRMVTMCIDCQ